MERKLTAILTADVVGYSRLMADDEKGTLSALTAMREFVDDLIVKAGGRIFGGAGYSVLVESKPPAVHLNKWNKRHATSGQQKENGEGSHYAHFQYSEVCS